MLAAFSITPQKARHCSQRKRLSPQKWFVSMKCTKANLKHRFAFLRLKFTVSFFSLPCKRLENARKALKIKPFVLFRAKSWFRINGREKISGLTLPTFCRLAHNVSARPLFKASFWGLETKASPHFEDLKTNRKNWASVIKEKPRRACRKINGSFWPTDIYASPLCPKFNLQRVPWKKSQNMVK